MTIRRILVPVDMSEYSRAALEVACELARACQADLHLMHAYGLSSSDYPYMAYMSTDVERHVVENSRRELEEWSKRCVPGDLPPKLHTSPKEPRVAVLEAAEELEADLIVMGTHGRSGLKRVLLGSVAEYVVRSATRPVLTVPHREEG